MKETVKALAINIFALTVSVVPPLLATLSYFPLWIERDSRAVISGLVLLLVLVSSIPIMRALKRALTSPSVVGIWLILFILFFFLSRIADEMTMISLVGLISNCIGAILFKIGRRMRGKV